MKKIKWKILIMTAFVCVAPIFLGIAMYDRLPDMVPIHFDINNNPDNFAPKGFAVFALPLLLLAFQIFACVVTDIAEAKTGKKEKLTSIAKWTIPLISLIIYPTTVFYALGNELDVRRIAVFVVGILFIVLGNYMPKANQIQIAGKMREMDSDKARRFLRIMSYMMVGLGFLFLISLFFPPIASVIVLLLLIPFTVITLIFGIKLSKGE